MQVFLTKDSERNKSKLIKWHLNVTPTVCFAVLLSLYEYANWMYSTLNEQTPRDDTESKETDVKLNWESLQTVDRLAAFSINAVLSCVLIVLWCNINIIILTFTAILYKLLTKRFVLVWFPWNHTWYTDWQKKRYNKKSNLFYSSSNFK